MNPFNFFFGVCVKQYGGLTWEWKSGTWQTRHLGFALLMKEEKGKRTILGIHGSKHFQWILRTTLIGDLNEPQSS